MTSSRLPHLSEPPPLGISENADVLGVILQALNEMFHAMCLKLLHSAWNNCSRVDKHLLLPFSRFLPSFVPSCLLPPVAPPTPIIYWAPAMMIQALF